MTTIDDSATEETKTEEAKTATRTTLTDQALVEGFEQVTLPAEAFDHERHVRLAWIYLRRLPLADALTRMGEGTRCFATAHGAPDKYHATITWGYVLAIHERMLGRAEDECWEAFREANADLLQHRPSPLERWYRPGTLATARAKRSFVMPDRLAPIADPLETV